MPQHWSARRIVFLGAIGGMLAGMMMALTEMLYGWVSDGRTFWDAPMAIWSWVFGLDHFGEPANHVWPIILGMGAHMVNSMMVGVVFAGLMVALRARGVAVPVMVGVAYALGIWAFMRYAILPLNNGEEALFTTDQVSPQWVWWLSHAFLGMTAGLYFGAVRRLFPAAPYEHEDPQLRRAA